MALLLTDSFATMTTTAEATAAGYTTNISTNITFDTTSGYNSAYCVKSDGNSSYSDNSCIQTPAFTPAATNEIHGSFWFKTLAAYNSNTNAPSAGYYLLKLHNEANDRCFLVGLSAAGFINASRFDDTTQPPNSFTGLANDLRDAQQHHIEFKLIVSDTVGYVQVWVDGVLSINQQNVDTNDSVNGDCTSFTRVRLSSVGSQAGGRTCILSHLMIWDASGSAMNGYVGVSRLEYLTPNAAGTNSALTPTAGANYTNVDEQVQNTDTDYVETPTNALKDSYNYTNLSGTPASIKAVMVKSFAKNPDFGTKLFRAICLSTATYANGSDKTLTTAYATYSEPFYLDPNTSAAWTAAGVNAAEFGVEVRS